MKALEVEVLDAGAGTKRDRKGRRCYPKAERDRLAQESFSGSLTVREFARRHGVRYNTLVLWRQQWKRRRAEAGGRDSGPVEFQELCVAPEPKGRLEVVLPDGTLVRGSDPAAVAQIVKALRC